MQLFSFLCTKTQMAQIIQDRIEYFVKHEKALTDQNDRHKFQHCITTKVFFHLFVIRFVFVHLVTVSNTFFFSFDAVFIFTPSSAHSPQSLLIAATR